ncbi:glycosyl transferase family 1 [Pseudalgibacter alginicilyticus]|uniref:Glycosyl transferase family 1 n=1 Tax=Pseudalgibacter alginicilyticus TaxID=1736674 RepID=A0A0P0CF01_9FLAO|nr:glycosyltransferase family 4 protein [Pseudalgibacter alginicilyticus]ALJ04576.1 glycosyl transferase family 1 [Pseudalgibacter alginicilyticus]
MKNLLYIGNNLSKVGKTETTVKTLSNFLKLEGFEVLVFSNKKNKIFRLLDMLLAVLKYSKKVDCVLIDTYSTSNFYYAFWCSQLCRVLNLKYLPILHGGNLPNRLKNNPKLSKAIFNNAYKNIAPSVYMKTEFEKYGFSNLICIPNTIELKNYPFKKRTFEKINLLWVRSFSEIYNPNLAIDILSELKAQGVDATLCMVGPANDDSLLKAKAYAKKIKVEVTFTGKLTKQEWISLSAAYNIFINTTNFDNMPVSVIEAMALGLPVLSTNVGGMPFLINNNEDGILVNPNQAKEFVDAIRRVQLNSGSSNSMALKARTKVEQFDWSKVKNQWKSVLN